MTLLARAGVPGAVLWALVLVSWFGMLMRAMLTARVRGHERWVELFLFVACYVMAILINASFDVTLEGPMQGIWFWCLFGFGIGSVMIYRARVSDGMEGLCAMTARDRSSIVRRTVVGALALLRPVDYGCSAAFAGVDSSSCPLDAIAVEPGNSIQAAVDRAGDGAVFCLKKGIHRAQAVRPRAGQRFYGEGETVLNGSRLLDELQARGALLGGEQPTPARAQARRMPAERARLRPARSACSSTTNR